MEWSREESFYKRTSRFTTKRLPKRVVLLKKQVVLPNIDLKWVVVGVCELKICQQGGFSMEKALGTLRWSKLNVERPFRSFVVKNIKQKNMKNQNV